MLTQCPGCQTVFRVTSAILRAAHGQVRCGRCNHQFDAISHLLDQDVMEESDTASDMTPSSSAADQQHSNQAAAPASEGFAGIGHEDIILEGTRIEISGIYKKPVNDHGESVLEQSQVIEEFNLDTEQWENPFVAAESQPAPQSAETSETPETTVSEPDYRQANAALDHIDTDIGINIDTHTDADMQQVASAESVDPLALNVGDEGADITDIEDELNAVDLAGELARLDAVSADTEPETPAPTRAKQDTHAAYNEELAHSIAVASAAGHMEEIVLSTGVFDSPLGDNTAKPADDLTTFLARASHVRAKPTQRWPWALACVLAVMLLTMQTVHHFRTELARHPGLGSVLINAYAKLGMALTPHWLVDAYTLKQWGIVSDPQQPGVLRMRASVTNVASFAQPYPLLRFTLEDRFGATVGQRDFKPEEYLTSREQANRLMPSNTAANIDLSIVDPGPEAVGFQLDSCLADAQTLRCAHDASVP